MKIDCPHCGVHGSVDDSLAGRKLRCPKCGKVFLITEDILPEAEDAGILHQEMLYDDGPQAQEQEVAEQEAVEVESAVEPEEVTDLKEDDIAVEIEESEEISEAPEESESAEETPDEDDSGLKECSVCRQSFSSEFMVEIESRLYCALCQPDSEEEGREIPGTAENEKDSGEDNGDILALMADEGEEDLDGEGVTFLSCSGCGETLHPEFLEKVGSKHYCALCVPEEVDESENTDDDGERELSETAEAEEYTRAEDEESLEKETESAEQDLIDDAEDEEVEDLKEPCSVCGEAFHPDFMQEVDGRMYCGVCQPEVVELSGDEGMDTVAGTESLIESDEESFGRDADFTIGELLKEAWQKTRGAKASIWGGVVAMYAIVLTVSFGGTAASQAFYKGGDPTLLVGVSSGLQLVSSWLSMLMTGGIMLIGVRRALEQRVSWRMVFAGFSKALSMTMAIILQSVLIVIGFILLVLPGIYLSVGYALTLPLILDKGMGPWEALEASRKAIHKKWWAVFGLYLVMLLISMVAAIPLGLGLLWVIPMYFVLIGVLYVRFFGSDGNDGEELVAAQEEYVEEDEEESDDEFAGDEEYEAKEPAVEPEIKPL